MTEPNQRRVCQRTNFNTIARYRVIGASAQGGERLCITKDYSRYGLYFYALNNLVRLGMRLVLDFHGCEELREGQRECVVEVVRTHELFPGRSGIGARYLYRRNLVRSRGNETTMDLNAEAPGEIRSCGIDLYV